MMAIRLLRRSISRIRGRILTALDLLRWEYFPAHKSNNRHLSAHLLVVKNVKYSQIAQICATSFLHYHPNATVIIHADESTQSAVSKWVSRSRFTHSIIIKPCNAESQESWQIQKINLVLSLSGTLDFFVDADMRWNSPLNVELNEGANVYFFVEEYKIIENTIFSSMIEHQDFSKYIGASMWNTSFVCFSGCLLSANQKSEILNLQDKIVRYARRYINDEIQSASTVRIAEQLAISMAASNWGVHLKAVKTVDGYKDGTFLESSYFGATGTHF